MNAPHGPETDWQSPKSASLGMFNSDAKARFAQCYPETPHLLRHGLDRHPLLEIEALADLAERLSEESVEYNRGDLPIGIDDKPGATGLSIGETIRSVHDANSWAVLKNVEQVPAYNGLLIDLLGDVQSEIEAATGRMLTPQAYVFISSPSAVTPYHFDPEHNILLQVSGSKVMTQFPAGNPRFAPDTTHESYHTGGPRELSWQEGFREQGLPFALGPGDAVYVPVMAPHYVQNGPDSSISLSITWRSEWSYRESDARAFNHLMRKRGLTPQATARWPANNKAKAYAYRALRKIGLNAKS
ncbi:cupin-like domain-containing protein [Erythrobacter crassostreae]|uniref:Cupin-like domain-containing protein n=1 Tax=Erythrobacter crassostreae TaxID=2828328 RepID=A0A9X1JMK4_9SPHN|nr:cupin-like domain-containing protein [Erythrobacter crassostrea]MBV7259509.1 cupin-like domain-containing protein [Erythrobacter crassostrea]